MSVNYHECPEVLFITVWRAPGYSAPGGELYWCGEWKQSLHKKFILVLWMQFSFLRFKLKEEPCIQYRYRRHANRGRVLKTCRLLLWLTCIFLLWLLFHMVYCEDKKKNVCSSEYVMKDKVSSLHKSDCILVTESHKVDTTGYQY